MDDILIVVDMQNDFITGSLGTAEAQAIVPAVADMVKKWKGTVFATMDTHDTNYLITQEGRKLPVPHCMRLTNGWLINEKIQKEMMGRGNVRYIEKGTFGVVDWDQIIEDTPSKSIYLVGVCTDICVVSNALILKAMFPKKEIYVIEDLCAGVTPDKHDAAIKTMESCQVNIVKSSDVYSKIEKESVC